MNEVIKKQWIRALRSGEYRQAERKLRRNNSFCCLGVLCDLHAKSTKQQWKFTGTCDPLNRRIWAYKGVNALPPDEVLIWAGLTRDVLRSFADANDAGGSFLAIAQGIEENL